MKTTLKLFAALMTGGLITLVPAQGQVTYATPYAITTIAGTPGVRTSANGNNGAGTFNNPQGAIVDTNDNVYVVDNGNNNIRKLFPAGGTNWSVLTIAGSTTGTAGSGDAVGTSASFNQPTDIAMDISNNLYVTDGGNYTLRKLTLSGQSWAVTTIAGTVNNGDGADGTNTAAHFNYPEGITVDTAGNLYVADTFDETIRKVTPVGTNWVVTTIAGQLNNNNTFADGTNQDALFFLPAGITIDRSNNLYVADSANNIIREIMPVGTNWVTVTIAGTASSSGGFVDGTNGDAQFNSPSGLSIDASGNLYVAEINNNAIRKVTPVGTNWVTTTLAGAQDSSFGYTNGIGPTVLFNTPSGVAADTAGNIFVSDTFNNVMRKGIVAALPNPTIAVVAGNMVISWAGPGGTLQTNADLAAGTWAAYGGTVSSSNGTNSVTLTPAPGNLFFRLTQ